MIRGLYELFYLLLWYGLFYGLAILVMIILMTSMVGNHPTLVDTGVSDPIPHMIMESREVCLRVDGCRFVDGICEDCVVRDVYLLNESLTHLN